MSSIEELWYWALAPVSGKSTHEIATAFAWHGRLMVLAWGVIFPPLLLVTRFYKVTPGQDWPRALDNPFWFINHRRFGYFLGIVSAAGLTAVLWHRWSAPLHTSLSGTAHVLIGWSFLGMCAIQLLSGALRGTHGGPVNPFTRQPKPREQWPGDHYCMTGRRVRFEYVHKWLGWVMTALSIPAVLSGLWRADAPRWMWVLIGLWWLCGLAVFVTLQARGRCIDTYQAIWGVDPQLPGNRRPQPIGFGIRRYTPETVANARWPTR